MLIIIKLLTLDTTFVRAYVVHETEVPFTLGSAERDGLHASYEWF